MELHALTQASRSYALLPEVQTQEMNDISFILYGENENTGKEATKATTVQYKLTWNTAISPSKSSKEGLFPSPSVGSIPGGHRKSQSETPITPSSGASGVGRMAWLGELEEL